MKSILVEHIYYFSCLIHILLFSYYPFLLFNPTFYYSNSQTSDLMANIKHNSNSKVSLTPWFITGFADAEGTFTASIVKNSKNRLGLTTLVAFSIKLHKKDEELLKLIQLYFGCGNIYKVGKNYLVFMVVNIKEIIDIVIPHFDKFLLQTKKKADFELFKKIVELVHRKEHLTLNGLQKIVNLKASLNFGLSEDLKAIFPNTVPVSRPLVKSSSEELPHPQWLAGFASGEGCFAVSLIKSSAYKTGVQVLLRFSLTQHSRDEQLLKRLENHLGCGKIFTRGGCR